MPCHQYRHAPLWREVIEQVRGGALGAVYLAQFEVLRTGPDPGSPHWRSGWRRRREFAGGGIVFDMGTHYFYLLRTLFGLPRGGHRARRVLSGVSGATWRTPPS